MGRPSTRAEFLDLLGKSQLLADRHFEKVKTYAWKHDELDDPERLAAQLIAGRVLTGFHASQLLRGRYRGFYVGSYKLLNLLGQGGMGRVYLAEQVRLQRLVALKVLRKSMILKSNQTVSRFRREAKTVALLRHNNIIQAFDYDEIDGVPFIVMEYIEGLDLGRLRDRIGQMDYGQAADIISQAASGLQHAHEMGLVHRDIKPANLLVDPKGVVKILDLGLVSDPTGNHNGLTNDGDQLGTIDYIAPEQALNSRTADIRADIYSLGAVFYTMVTGNLLFPGRSTTEKLLLHQTDTPTPISATIPDFPAQLADVVEKMISRKPQDRFDTPDEVAEALAPFCQRKTPPYELDWIKYRASERSQFLDRSPRASHIVVRRSTAAPSSVPADIANENSHDSGNNSSLSQQSNVSQVASGISTVAPSEVLTRLPKKRVTKRSAAKRPARKPNRLFRIGLVAVASLLLIALATSIPGLMSAAETGSILPESEPQQYADASRTKPSAPAAYAMPLPESQAPTVVTSEELPLLLYVENDTPMQRPYDGSAGIMGPSPTAIAQDFACSENPYSGQQCLKIEFDGSRWGGVSWQAPSNGWGRVQGGFDLSVATKLSFWARGQNGGEMVQFKVGETDRTQEFPDSDTRSLDFVALTTEWQKFEIEIGDLDMTEMKSGFTWIVESDSPVTFFLDDIVYE